MFYIRVSCIYVFCVFFTILYAQSILLSSLTNEQQNNNKLSAKRISLNFQHIEIRAVLQILAKFTHTNIVVSDHVHGNITIHLNNISCQQALDIILKTNGLDKYIINNVLFIDLSNTLLKYKQQEVKKQQIISNLTPLITELVQINYAKAMDIKDFIKNNHAFLSARGIISCDQRINAVWLQDTANNVHKIKKLIKKLDVPIKQVQIEARIVNITKEAISELGMKLGVRKINDIDELTNKNHKLGKLNIDFGSIIEQTLATGLSIAKIQNGRLLDLQLAALENENKVKIIANPRLLTTNQHPAIIESGEEIPYQESTVNGGASVAFKKAVLSLKVTPHIMPDKKLLMQLEINQDTPSGRVINGVPAISTKAIRTNVLVNNLQTLVLGGIYRHDDSDAITKLPFFGNLPIIGLFFKQKQHKIKNEELLIFITPRIIKSSD